MIKLRMIIIMILLAVPLIKSEAQVGKLSEIDLKFIKENYNWNVKNILIINFAQPKTNCFYDHYIGINDPNNNWWEKFYSKVNLENCHNIFVFSDKNAANKIIDSKFSFYDKENFLLKSFFANGKLCWGVLIINKLGEYEKYDGEYQQNTVSKFIENLSGK
jgi:hypothetical protein